VDLEILQGKMHSLLAAIRRAGRFGFMPRGKTGLGGGWADHETLLFTPSATGQGAKVSTIKHELGHVAHIVFDECLLVKMQRNNGRVSVVDAFRSEMIAFRSANPQAGHRFWQIPISIILGSTVIIPGAPWVGGLLATGLLYVVIAWAVESIFRWMNSLSQSRSSASSLVLSESGTPMSNSIHSLIQTS
jgi:hypothetical protein